MSGASDLDKFDDRNLGDQMRDEEMKDFQKLNLGVKEKENNKIDFDFSKYADEWDAINMYNKKKFEEDKKREKIKDHEMKLRTRNDLDNQIKQKIKKQYEEKLREKEGDKLFQEHLKKNGPNRKRKKRGFKTANIARKKKSRCSNKR